VRVFLQETVVREALSDVQCNVCGRSVNKDTIGYFEDHLSISKAWGYHSPYDGEIHGIDVCVDCYQSWIVGFVIPPKITCYFHFEENASCACAH